MSTQHTLWCPRCKRAYKATPILPISREEMDKVILDQPWLMGMFYVSSTGCLLMWPVDAVVEPHDNRCIAEKHPMYLRPREITREMIDERENLRLTCTTCGRSFRRKLSDMELLPSRCDACLGLEPDFRRRKRQDGGVT